MSFLGDQPEHIHKNMYMYSLCDMVKIYLSVIRPLLEYTCPVWHTGLPKYLSDSIIETVQKRALACIYPGLSYNDILNITKLPTLQQRRDNLCLRTSQTIRKESHGLHNLLLNVIVVAYDLRNNQEYPVPKVRTSRFKNSYIPWCLRSCQ